MTEQLDKDDIAKLATSPDVMAWRLGQIEGGVKELAISLTELNKTLVPRETFSLTQAELKQDIKDVRQDLDSFKHVVYALGGSFLIAVICPLIVLGASHLLKLT